MGQLLETRLHRLSAPEVAGLVRSGLRGVERECLRITPAGKLARTPHPRAIGSALTNAYITTDYSEALLEFVTPPQLTNWETIQFLCDLHQFVMEHIGDELIWPLSMPCSISSDADVPLAQYGSSHIGRMKTIYRKGLGHRYGRIMQAISGVHYNYSLPDSFWPVYQELEGQSGGLQDFRSETYLAAVRNVRRLGWLLLYLFGASPALCKGFVRGREPTGLEDLDSGTLYGPFATSLRMSDLGYRNSAQANLVVSANSLDEYVRDLYQATHVPRPEFERIGVKAGGEYRQLNANQLQIENEFYSTIRPKRVADSGERPTAALLRGGVQYLELRMLDVSPWDPVGINQRQMRFLEVFLIYCLLQESPPISGAEQDCIDRNLGLVARRGRDPGLELAQCGGSVPLKDWAGKICRDMVEVARLIDPGEQQGHVAAIHHQLQSVEDPEQTPSAAILRELRSSGQTLAQYGLELAGRTRDYFFSLAPELNRHRDLLTAEAEASLIRQRRIEEADDEPFEEYLARYLA
ncbi:MAG: glutamate--cysteine ligase [Gammaproteobacteria bacterium]|nr:glutamate--cysteine ligase [Gammaproteobacteria bacterium]